MCNAYSFITKATSLKEVLNLVLNQNPVAICHDANLTSVLERCSLALRSALKSSMKPSSPKDWFNYYAEVRNHLERIKIPTCFWQPPGQQYSDWISHHHDNLEFFVFEEEIAKSLNPFISYATFIELSMSSMKHRAGVKFGSYPKIHPLHDGSCGISDFKPYKVMNEELRSMKRDLDSVLDVNGQCGIMSQILLGSGTKNITLVDNKWGLASAYTYLKSSNLMKHVTFVDENENPIWKLTQKYDLISYVLPLPSFSQELLFNGPTLRKRLQSRESDLREFLIVCKKLRRSNHSPILLLLNNFSEVIYNDLPNKDILSNLELKITAEVSWKVISPDLGERSPFMGQLYILREAEDENFCKNEDKQQTWKKSADYLRYQPFNGPIDVFPYSGTTFD